MGKKAARGSPAPKAKKAKVEADPVADACKHLAQFFEETANLPWQVQDSVTSAIGPLLYKEPADRHPLETSFAAAIGQVLQASTAEIDAEVAQTAVTEATAAAEEAAAQANADAAAQGTAAAVEKVAAAQAVASEAEEARDAAVRALDKHQKEVSQLSKTKTKLEGEEHELAAGLELFKTSQGSAKDAKKIVSMLRAAGVSEACCLAVPNALGKTGAGGFEAIVVQQASAGLGGKYNEVAQKLKDWEGHCHQMMDSTASLIATAQRSAESLASRQGELAGAEQMEKAAKTAKKAAEATLAKHKKEVVACRKTSSAASAKKAAADEAAATYDLLLHRPTPAPADEEPAGDADAMHADA